MKLSKEDLMTLGNFAEINNNIHIKPGNVIMTRDRKMTVYADMVMDTEITEEMKIYDLQNFIRILSLVGVDSEITVENNQINIRNGKSIAYFPLASSNIDVPDKQVVFPPTILEFKLTKEVLKQMMDLCRAVQADVISIASSDDSIVLRGFNQSLDTDLERSLFELNVADLQSDVEFNFFFKLKFIKLVQSDYIVSLWGKGNQAAAKFNSNNVNYIISPERRLTTFNF